MNQHLGLLGMRVRDRVTEFSGVVTSISFDLYGCIQAVVTPGLDKDGKKGESSWYDVARLQVLSSDPVMEAPDFNLPRAVAVADGRKGAAEKPPMP